METKVINIEIPEGYEIDKEKSTFEKIVFKPINNKPRSWEEYCKNHKGDFYYITSDSNIAGVGFNPGKIPLDVDIAKNTIPSKELAEAFLAMMQLMSLRQSWIGDWKPNWSDDSTKWSICSKRGNIVIIYCTSISSSLSFPTNQMAQDFSNTFKDLLEQAKSLI